MYKRLALAAMLAISLGGIATPASAQIYLRIGPPEPRVEMVPEPRPGYVWVAGHWEWRNQRHQWIKGVWLRERRGYEYYPPAWVERDDGRWNHQRGKWKRNDRDGDGIKNKNDRAPDNPYRR